MIRLLWLFVLLAIGCRLLTGRWPWDWLAARPQQGRDSPPARDAEKARVLLGLHPGASREEIIEAHRKLVVMVHPDKGGTADQVHEANAARDLLLAMLAPRVP